MDAAVVILRFRVGESLLKQGTGLLLIASWHLWLLESNRKRIWVMSRALGNVPSTSMLLQK
jgi:hypothetical protein